MAEDSSQSLVLTLPISVSDTRIDSNGKRHRRPSDVESSQSPASKRPRAPSESMDPVDTEVASASLRIKRDPTYYFEDGSCIFLVEDTLFNVHRTRLSNDSSSFGTMFTLPQGALDSEGRTDENPIVLSGDTASEFRNFLWTFYALPPDISKASENLPQLIDIARVSNKYAFKNLEAWALNTIHEYVNRKPSPILAAVPTPQTYTFSGIIESTTSASPASATTASTELLTKLIHLAQMCNHEPLLGTMVGHLKQLMSSSLQYAYLAMTLADELDIRTLRGVAYLEVMQKAVVVKRTRTDVALKAMADAGGSGSGVLVLDSSASASTIAAPSGSTTPQSPEDGDENPLAITCAQQLRLLSGYYRLTGTWERLRVTPPSFEHASSCGATWHQHGCTQSWVEFWKEKTRSEAVLALGLADVVGRLKTVHKEYERWGSAPYMHHDCRNAARKAIAEVIKKVEAGLPDFFSEGGEET
ncbi:hypothetical protein DXG03_004584 [Asterophora parasitica]|uniref:BTB domain-containing protein n=1 Tax=Asterophora parasitica TaxID=117018 RepID=A0A9P7G9I0_9AGAR|nr:hypothetical protein DXG03_004584 [Asterophora parasitica]